MKTNEIGNSAVVTDRRLRDLLVEIEDKSF